MTASKMTTKGQVTIPKSIREVLGIRPGDRIAFVRDAEGRVFLEAETVDVRSLRGMLKHDGPPVSLEKLLHVGKEFRVLAASLPEKIRQGLRGCPVECLEKDCL